MSFRRSQHLWEAFEDNDFSPAPSDSDEAGAEEDEVDDDDEDDNDDDDSGDDIKHDKGENGQLSVDEGFLHNILVIFICDAMNCFCIRAGCTWRAIGPFYYPQVARTEAGGRGAKFIAGESVQRRRSLQAHERRRSCLQYGSGGALSAHEKRTRGTGRSLRVFFS